MIAERYLDGYDRVRIAVCWDEYDEDRKDALNEIEWDEYHCGYDGGHEWRDGQTRDFAWTMDYSGDAVELLRQASGERVPAEPAWNVDVYETSPGSDPRECEACRESAVLGARGLRACNMHRSPEMAVLEDSDANQVCTACGQFFRYQTREGENRETQTDGGITGATGLHEAM